MNGPHLDEVGPGAFAYVQPDGGWMVNNTGLVVGPGGRSVVVDTSSTERRTRAFLAEVDARTTGAPMALVNTHHHPDHTYGNCFIPEETPVVGHALCRTEARAAGLAATKVLTAPDYGELTVRTPDITFTDRLTLHLDEIAVELRHFGPAHTTNDVVVWLPGSSVVYAGDLAFAGGQPFLLEGSVAGFVGALDGIRALEPEVLVPGHGPVVRGDAVGELLDDLTSYIEFVADVAAASYAAGLSPLEAAEKHRDNPYRDWQETERLVGNLHRAYAELAASESGTTEWVRLAVPDVWPDLVAFNGGPIACHA
jgi:cyclase